MTKQTNKYSANRHVAGATHETKAIVHSNMTYDVDVWTTKRFGTVIRMERFPGSSQWRVWIRTAPMFTMHFDTAGEAMDYVRRLVSSED